MRTYELDRQQRLFQPVEQVFAFFAEARNLESITPPWLHFCVLNQENIVMQRGATIDYRLRVHGVPFRWPRAFCPISRPVPLPKIEAEVDRKDLTEPTSAA